MSDIERLRVVATVARTHSMNEAARVHGVAQSTVTRSVAATERLLGFALFQRGTAGAQLAVGAAEALALIDRIVADFDALRTIGGGRPAAIRIAHRNDVPLPDRIDGLIGRWNRSNTLLVEVIAHDDPIGALTAGEVDFALERFTRDMHHDLEGQVVRVTRLDRVELINRPAPSAEVRSFLSYLG